MSEQAGALLRGLSQRLWCRMRSLLLAQEVERIELEAIGDALNALEREVALASLQAAHVGAVYAYDIGEYLLA